MSGSFAERDGSFAERGLQLDASSPPSIIKRVDMSILQKSPVICGSFAKRDLQFHAFDASLSPSVMIRLYLSFPQKSPTISGSLAERDLQFEASNKFLPSYIELTYRNCL